MRATFTKQRQLLHGEATVLTEAITERMNAAAETLDFETAACLRDQILRCCDGAREAVRRDDRQRG